MNVLSTVTNYPLTFVGKGNLALLFQRQQQWRRHYSVYKVRDDLGGWGFATHSSRQQWSYHTNKNNVLRVHYCCSAMIHNKEMTKG